MINGITLFDCTIREVGYQTGWWFDTQFLRDYYRFIESAGYDYMELGFFHNQEADPGRGICRYCSTCAKELQEVFGRTKNILKLSAMRDIQRPLSPMIPRSESIVDTVRILTRSKETDLDILAKHVNELRELGYNIFVNFTSAGNNTIELNQSFAKFAKKEGIPTIYFADTESIFTAKYVSDTIEMCRAEGVEAGMHLHNKNGTAEQLLEVAFAHSCKFTDSTLLGLGGKWCDGNIPTEILMKHFGFKPGFEMTKLKNALVQQLIQFRDKTAAVY